MWTDSSQARTWLACASASEYTATVRIAMRRAVAATRQAISPRLAMRIFLNIRSVSRRILFQLKRRHDARIGSAAEDAGHAAEQSAQETPALADEPHAEHQHDDEQHEKDERMRHREPQPGRHHRVFDQRGA